MASRRGTGPLRAVGRVPARPPLRGHVRFHGSAHGLQELTQTLAVQAVQLRLAANASHGQAFPQPPFHTIAPVLHDLHQHLHESPHIRPRKLLTGLQHRRRRTVRRLPFVLFQQLRKPHQVFESAVHRPTPIRRGRRARETHADPPLIACRYEHERKQTAHERFDLGPEPLLKPAMVGTGQKHATPIRPMFQRPLLRAPAHRRRTTAWEQPQDRSSGPALQCEASLPPVMTPSVRRQQSPQLWQSQFCITGKLFNGNVMDAASL